MSTDLRKAFVMPCGCAALASPGEEPLCPIHPAEFVLVADGGERGRDQFGNEIDVPAFERGRVAGRFATRRAAEIEADRLLANARKAGDRPWFSTNIYRRFTR